MRLDSAYDLLDDEERVSAAQWMRQTFSPILTRWEPFEGKGRAVVQLQLIDRKAHALLHHRLDFCTFSSDRLILDHHLVVHRVNFIRKGVRHKENSGDYVETVLEFSDLWEIGRRLRVPKNDMQVLLLEEGVRRVLDVDALRPYLPERLRQVDLVAISQSEGDSPSEMDSPRPEDPSGRRGGRLDLLS